MDVYAPMRSAARSPGPACTVKAPYVCGPTVAHPAAIASRPVSAPMRRPVRGSRPRSIPTRARTRSSARRSLGSSMREDGTDLDEAETTTFVVEETEAILGSGSAGGKVIRGGLLRAGGYIVGTIAATAASVVLLRYLGPVAVGQYVTVMSLLAIVGGLTDAGLTVIGQREYTIATTDERRRRLLADIVAMRLAITPVGVILATGFALLAGYDHTLVLGTLIGGAGVVVANVAA